MSRKTITVFDRISARALISRNFVFKVGGGGWGGALNRGGAIIRGEAVINKITLFFFYKNHFYKNVEVEICPKI